MNNLAEKTIIFSDDILQDYVIIYNEKDINEEDINEENINEENKSENKERTPEELILYFLTCCDIKCSDMNNINGQIIPREILLDQSIYNKIKSDIPRIKHLLSSTKFTAVQKDAELSQKWPLINLIRQILRKYNYLLIPKRVCDGYTKDGVKKYKRFFEIMEPINISYPLLDN